MQHSPILIIGKNGKTGARVHQHLQALGHATCGVSRTTSPAFDWEDQSTWRPALAGTTSAYITFQPDLAIPGATRIMEDFVQLAVDCGLQHLVLLSGRGEDGARRAEAVVQSSGVAWNVVRASWFMQNFSESFMLEGVLKGELVLPAGDVLEPFVDVDDIADVAVAALTRPALHNRVFELTGPRALSFTQCAREISRAVGYPVSYTQIPVEAFLQALRDQGLPEGMLWLMRELFTVVLDGRNSQVMSGVEEALGRPATDFSAYLEKVMAMGTWQRSGMRQSA